MSKLDRLVKVSALINEEHDEFCRTIGLDGFIDWTEFNKQIKDEFAETMKEMENEVLGSLACPLVDMCHHTWIEQSGLTGKFKECKNCGKHE